MKPEYFFRPTQLVLRLFRREKPTGPEFTILNLPWGTPIQVGLHETIGQAIWQLGVYELAVSETLWRLIDPDDFVIDIGANIGYMTSLMAVRVGKNGIVMAFEPHPLLFGTLQANVSRWHDHVSHLSQIQLINSALSDENGKAELIIPHDFHKNEGIAFLAPQKNSIVPENHKSLAVSVDRLDRVLEKSSHSPDLIKIDVEGHENQVLTGAGKLLSERKIRDIVFEDHGTYPTPAMQILEICGYALFKIRRSFTKPVLTDPKSPDIEATSAWEPVNYLATSQPERAIARLKSRGWRCLHPSSMI